MPGRIALNKQPCALKNLKRQRKPTASNRPEFIWRKKKPMNDQLPKNVTEVLRRARKLISRRQSWTQQCEARNKDLHPCPPNHPDAVTFCMVGAIHNVCGLDCDDPNELLPEYKVSRDAYRALQDTVRRVTAGQAEAGYTVEQYNDTHTHRQILNLIDTATIEEK